MKLQLSMKQKCKVNIYVLDGLKLESRDYLKNSDPYVAITIGHNKWDNRARYKSNTTHPDFFEKCSLQAVFPGASLANIEVFDYDTLFGDDLIGKTSIDLEDRFYSNNW